MGRFCRVLLAAAAAGSLLLSAGCAHQMESGLSSEQKQQSSRLGEIAQRTGGDWDKLSPDERNFLVNEPSHGSEKSARMLLLGSAGKIGGRPGSPPGRPVR